MSKVHVVFDLDDTLYPEHEHAYSGFRAIGRHAAEVWGIEGLAQDMIDLLDKGHLGAVFKLSIAARMPDHTDDHIAELREIYRSHQPDIALYEDGRWALEHYAARAELGLITDGHAGVQAKKIEALDIASYFREMVLTGSLGAPREFHKPHPRAYQIIEARIGAPGDRYVYVGDNPAKDFVTPNARGWTSVQVLRERNIHDPKAVVDGGCPQHCVRSLRELPDILGF
ncbi:MAG: HAD family hydrolase [Alphaproteobacteria bacterium]|nr:HAD family hydrolase [Alphaproteobacteria bacterium]